ncbi:hypothetical protein BP5796_13098 [Coleophoma crateriformis]|uniref:Cupin 2 conserved barrel domain-containing protein n=1 Tax=Coleophoma crateriformis TaxID=565419 RepID=A0A3D8Q467_9HELO|nr:hypothetical protein BP5796_13098 [Coleophoma crateriformis]
MAEASVTPSSDLREPNRYITATNNDGKSVFSSALPESLPVVRNINEALLRLCYVTDRPPVSLAGNIDITAYGKCLENPPELVPPGGGSVVWYIDTPPEGSSPMHRTISLDLVVLLEGEVELLLDGGETRLLRPGDLTLQRATMHAWRNPSKIKWTRMLGVMSECEPVEIGGKKLRAEFS